jgi:hypothetical protein
MGMGEPFLVRAHHPTAYTCLVDGRLEIQGIPLGHRFSDGLWARFAAEQLQHPCLQVGQAEMRKHPTSILCRPWLSDRPHCLVVLVDHWREYAVCSRALQVGRAAQAGCCMAYINRELEASTGLHLPYVRDGDANTAEHSGTGFPDFEARREYGVGAGDRNFAG